MEAYFVKFFKKNMTPGKIVGLIAGLMALIPLFIIYVVKIVITVGAILTPHGTNLEMFYYGTLAVCLIAAAVYGLLLSLSSHLIEKEMQG